MSDAYTRAKTGGETLAELMARAENTALAGGYTSKGKARVLVNQSIEMCGRPDHRSSMWRLPIDGAKWICGVCHPPAPRDIVRFQEASS